MRPEPSPTGGSGRPGNYTIEVGPAVPNAKQGGSFFHMIGYYLVR